VTVPHSPYKGLEPFDDSDLDALLFFGRERERDVVIANLMASRLTLLYGPSGVGKSSLLNAGVARRLLDEPEGHRLLVIRSWVEDRADELRVAVGGAAAGSYLYVILDQFEEFFLYHDVDGPFGRTLAELLADRGRQVNVLLSLREDALAQLDAFKGRIANLYANSLRLDHLDRASARAAVLGPLARYEELTGEHVAAEPELVEAVLDQVATGRLELVEAGRGALEDASREGRIEAPFLQLVLERLWDVERAAGSEGLRLATLDGLGGSQAIVREHLARALAALDPGEKDVAASVFDHLVTPSGTKIAHRASDLAEYASVGERELSRVLDTLGRERILRSVDGANGGGRRYEIFHDVLADPVLAWRAERRLERERHEADRKHRRLIAVAASSLVALAITAGVAVFALAERKSARAEARHAHARELTASALAQLPVDPELSLLLAVAAARIEPTRQVEDVLRQAAIASHERFLLAARGPVTSATFSPDGRFILTASEDGAARLYTRAGARVAVLRHGGPVTGAAFSPDGALIASAGSDDTARIWSLGRQVAVLRHPAAVEDVAFAGRGRILITAGADGRARIWRGADGSLVGTLGLPGPVSGAALSRDGSLAVAVATDPAGHVQARIFSVRSGRLVRLLDEKGVVTAGFSPDGRLVVTTSKDRTARIWRARDGRLLHVLPHEGHVVAATFSRDGKLLATASEDGATRVWDVATGARLLLLVGPTGFVESVSFSRDGRFLVAGSADRTARVYDVHNGKELAVLAGHTDAVIAAEFSPDGRAIVTAGRDRTVRVWDPGVEDQLRAVVASGYDGAAFSRDGTRIVARGQTVGAAVWSVPSRQQLATFGDSTVRDAAFSPDGKLVAGAGRDVLLWRVRGGVPIRRIAGPTAPQSASFSPDGRLLAIAGVGGAQIRLVADGTLVHSLALQGLGFGASFSSHGGLVLTDVLTTGGDVLSEWDALNGRLLHTLRATGTVARVSFGPDGGRVLAAYRDGTARIWDADSGRTLHVLRGHTQPLTDAEFSRDGRLVVTTSLDGDGRVWDAGSGRLLHVLRGHFSAVNAASFSPDGRWIVSAGPTTAGLWETDTGRLVFYLRGHKAALTSASFDPGGRLILTSSTDGSVRIYRCGVCLGIRGLVALAETRLMRTGRAPSAYERARYGLG
jgi:WD40 repeat protein